MQKYNENAIGLAISSILVLFKDIDVYSQVHSGLGITDIVAVTKDTIYIMELKLDLEDASTALDQIKNKDYSSIFVNNPQYKKKPIVMMGLSFRSSDASLIDCKIDPKID